MDRRKFHLYLENKAGKIEKTIYLDEIGIEDRDWDFMTNEEQIDTMWAIIGIENVWGFREVTENNNNENT